MGKTYKKGQSFRPKSHGQTFSKENQWKKKKKHKHGFDKPNKSIDELQEDNL